MKKASLFLVLLLSSCSSNNISIKDESDINNVTASVEECDNNTIFVATDLHYIATSLKDDGPLFTNTIMNGDGKLVEYSDKILDKLIERCLNENAKALVISGDLTFNGELESLKEIKAKLNVLKNRNIDVLVIPGNHDINYPYAYKYHGSTYTRVDNISMEAFKNEMGDFYYNNALLKHPNSFSYVYDIDDNNQLLFIDTNTLNNTGFLTRGVYDFVEDVLKRASESNKNVYTITHQNILEPCSKFSASFVIDNRDVLLELYKKYNVYHNFSGHSHLNKNVKRNDFTDHILGSISVAPLAYGKLSLKDKIFNFDRYKIDEYYDLAIERFNYTTTRSATSSLNSLALDDNEKKSIIDLSNELNLDYFSNNMKEISYYTNHPGYSLCQENRSYSFWFEYMLTIIDDYKNGK